VILIVCVAVYRYELSFDTFFYLETVITRVLVGNLDVQPVHTGGVKPEDLSWSAVRKQLLKM
jgi:hypothetical protein